MRLAINLVGKSFGPFEVIERDISKNTQNKNKAAYWICKCGLCGSFKSYRSDVLRKECPTSCGCAAIKIRTGDQFGHLTVLKNINAPSSRSKQWMCRCDCGKDTVRTSNYLKIYPNGSCGCFWNPSGMESPAYKGCGELYASIFNRIKRGAVKRKLKFDVTIEELWKLYLDQNRYCSLSGLPISFGVYCRSDKGKPCTASLDRISSEIGYTLDNIQWVHKDINIMKNKSSQDEFIKMCGTIAKYNGII